MAVEYEGVVAAANEWGLKLEGWQEYANYSKQWYKGPQFQAGQRVKITCSDDSRWINRGVLLDSPQAGPGPQAAQGPRPGPVPQGPGPQAGPPPDSYAGYQRAAEEAVTPPQDLAIIREVAVKAAVELEVANLQHRAVRSENPGPIMPDLVIGTAQRLESYILGLYKAGVQMPQDDPGPGEPWPEEEGT